MVDTASLVTGAWIACGRLARWLRIPSVVLMLCLPSWAQPQTRPPGYDEAAQAFHGLDLSDRINRQILMTTAGYLSAVPNESFNQRIFDNIARLQADHGYPQTGWLTREQAERLVNIAMPYLDYWGFRTVPHPERNKRSIWVPLGLGLLSQRTETGLTFRDPDSDLVLSYDFFPNVSVGNLYEHTLAKLVQAHTEIHYKVSRKQFFAISSYRDRVSSYARYHQDGHGVLGFTLTWGDAAIALQGERIATLLSGSLRASMTGASFAVPPARRALRQPPAPQPEASPKPEQKSTSSAAGQAQEDDRIYYGSRVGMHLTTVSKEGIGSAHAVIRVKHTPKDAKAYCVEYEGDYSISA
jgi:serine protease Do